MTNPFELMKAGRHHNDVLQAVAVMSKFDLDTAAKKLDDKEVTAIGSWTSATCRTIGIQKTLIYGGLLHLFSAATEERGKAELFEELLKELGLSRTQAYRCRAAWRSFGALLIESPEVRDSFVSESLKTLSENSVPEAAREEAIELAKSGERISIGVAKSLRKKHCAAALDTTGRESKGQGSSKIWQFVGSVVRIVLEPTTSQDAADVDAVIRDLQSAIDELRRGYEVNHVESATPAGVTEGV